MFENKGAEVSKASEGIHKFVRKMRERRLMLS